ncbi:hypothetical protein GCM10009835_16150 [Planosporangium flavigriseum]
MPPGYISAAGLVQQEFAMTGTTQRTVEDLPWGHPRRSAGCPGNRCQGTHGHQQDRDAGPFKGRADNASAAGGEHL